MRGPPREGDGFTFEHLAARDELWLDFCADTGDGGCAVPLAACWLLPAGRLDAVFLGSCLTWPSAIVIF